MSQPATLTMAIIGPAAAPVLASLHAACFADAWTEATMAGMLESPSTTATVAGCGEVAVGFILWRIAADEAEVLTIGVAPSLRRRGVGLQLMRQAMAEAAKQGARRFLLEVAEDNAAAFALYRRLGFAAVGRRPKYYRITDEVAVDALILARDLGQVAEGGSDR